MIKFSSTGFVICLVILFFSSISTIFMPHTQLIGTLINISSITLLIMGILLIIALIKDRFNESKQEKDDYKKY